MKPTIADFHGGCLCNKEFKAASGHIMMEVTGCILLGFMRIRWNIHGDSPILRMYGDYINNKTRGQWQVFKQLKSPLASVAIFKEGKFGAVWALDGSKSNS